MQDKVTLSQGEIDNNIKNIIIKGYN